MKSVCIAGSFKFYSELLELESKLKEAGLSVEGPVLVKKYRKEENPSVAVMPEGLKEEEMLEDMRQMVSKFQAKIDKQDVFYVLCPNGYVGKQVSSEMGYAKKGKKEIFSTHPIEELTLRALVDEIKSPDELIKYCQNKL